MAEAAGNGAKAAELAGYAKNSAKVTASRLLTKPNVKAAVEARRREIEEAAAAANPGRIADASERRALLTTMLRDAEFNPAARVKAADVLNKMDGVYIQKHEHAGADGGPVEVRFVDVGA